MSEPKQAFPYQPPSKQLKQRYAHIFKIQSALQDRFFKRFFDIAISLPIFLLSVPVMMFIKIIYSVEGFIIKENAGPMFFFYWAISKGKKIKKWKIRLIKEKYIDKKAAQNNDWKAYAAEWNDQSRTHVGSFVKKWYLDELPQFWSVLKGDMSIVGPRPLAVIHYERDLEQGNVTRKLLKGGLLGLGHINKGTSEMGNPRYEYEYIDKYIKKSSFQLMLLDVWIIYKGIALMMRGGGH